MVGCQPVSINVFRRLDLNPVPGRIHHHKTFVCNYSIIRIQCFHRFQALCHGVERVFCRLSDPDIVITLLTGDLGSCPDVVQKGILIPNDDFLFRRHQLKDVRFIPVKMFPGNRFIVVSSFNQIHERDCAVHHMSLCSINHTVCRPLPF